MTVVCKNAGVQLTVTGLHVHERQHDVLVPKYPMYSASSARQTSVPMGLQRSCRIPTVLTCIACSMHQLSSLSNRTFVDTENVIQHLDHRCLSANLSIQWFDPLLNKVLDNFISNVGTVTTMSADRRQARSAKEVPTTRAIAMCVPSSKAT